MRWPIISIGGMMAFAAASPASAATIVIYADPMTLDRRMVIVDPTGPDRAYLCMMPPAVSGCHAVPFKRARA
jgi:hypothetical protein